MAVPRNAQNAATAHATGARTAVQPHNAARLTLPGSAARRFAMSDDEVGATLAAELLRHSDLPIADVASRLGFADAANFGRAFRGWHGVPPGRFRSG